MKTNKAIQIICSKYSILFIINKVLSYQKITLRENTQSASKYESSKCSSIIFSFSFFFLESFPGLKRKLTVPFRN